MTTTAPAPTPVVAPRPAAGPAFLAPARRVWLACGALVIAVFAQAPGRIIPESKLDLVLNPGAFLARATHMWDPHTGFGRVSNQPAGYLFPMGPFYALGHLAHVPMWIVQRAWMSLLLVVALQGIVRLAEELGIGTSSSRLVGGVAYAIAPAFLTQVASTSATQTAAALLPWVVLPLVRGTRKGSTRRAAARSALAVVAMGAVNAASVGVVLVVPLAYLLTREPSPRRRALLRHWLVAVSVGSLWWAVPLALQWRYGQPFTLFTERASLTTVASSAFETVRGTSYWVGYLFTSGPWLRGAWRLISSPVAIAATCAVAAAGLHGLASRSLPERRFLIWTATLGTAAMVAGYGGALGDPLAGGVRGLLDGPLVVLRNVHKFDPVLRFALCLGLAHVVGRVATHIQGRRLARAIAVVGATLLLALAALPLTTGTLAPAGAFSSVPVYWRDAARWLNANADGGRTLVVPAAAFGEYSWGRPLDEPLASLVDGPWAVRDIVPLGSSGGTRLLDAVSRIIEDGQGSPGLAPALSRSGVRYLLVRNDLDLGRAGAPAPVFVRAALAGSSGIRRVAGFGPQQAGGMTGDRLSADLGASERAAGFRAVEIFEVTPPPSKVVAYPMAGSVSLSGGPESLVSLAGRGIVDGRAVTLTGDSKASDSSPAAWVVTDTARRRDVHFGSVRQNATYTLTASESAPGTKRPPRDRLMLDGIAHQTVARMVGAASVSASSVVATPIDLPEGQPFAAFDSDPASAWIPALTPSTGEWIQIDFEHPLNAAAVSVRLLTDQPIRPQITRLRVTTEHGVLDQKLDSVNPHVLSLPPGPTRWLRLTIEEVFGLAGGTNGPGISDIHIPGVVVARPLVVPDDLRGPLRASVATGFVFERAVSDSYNPARGAEDVRIDRAFNVPMGAPMRVTGRAIAEPGAALDALLAAQRTHAPIQASASSVWNEIPAFAAQRALDGDLSTAWIASPQDAFPSIHLGWLGVRFVDSLQIVPADGPTLQPVHVRVDSPAGTRDVEVLNDQVVTFPPLATDQITVTVVQTARSRTASEPGLATPFAVGIGELRVPAVSDLIAGAGEKNAVLDLPCGTGPAVVLDGQTLPTSLHAALRDVVELKPVPFEVCGAAVELSTGEHRVTTGLGDAFAANGLTLLPPALAGPAPPPMRSATAGRWGSRSRDVDLGAGQASVLTTTENFNDGWQASFGGQRLQSVRVDGWRQGWLVPSGAGGTVHLRYGPDTGYRAGLGLGAVAIVVLLVAAVTGRRRDADVAPTRAGEGSVLGPLAVIGLGVLLAGPVGVGLAALAVWVLPAAWRARVAACAFALAGVVVVVDHGRFPTTGHGAFSRPVQFLSACAIVAVAAGLADRARPAFAHATSPGARLVARLRRDGRGT